jgi:hypothetical protein
VCDLRDIMVYNNGRELNFRLSVLSGRFFGGRKEQGNARSSSGVSGGDGNHIYKSVNFGTDPTHFGKDWHARDGKRAIERHLRTASLCILHRFKENFWSKNRKRQHFAKKTKKFLVEGLTLKEKCDRIQKKLCWVLRPSWLLSKRIGIKEAFGRSRSPKHPCFGSCTVFCSLCKDSRFADSLFYFRFSNYSVQQRIGGNQSNETENEKNLCSPSGSADVCVPCDPRICSR